MKRQANKRTTLADVAKAAGVSNSTVSFVLNRNHPIGPAVTKRVQKAIRDLNYTPHEAARQLSSHSGSKMLGVVMEDCADTAESIDAYHQAISARGYRMYLLFADKGHENAVRAIKDISSGARVAGFVNTLPSMSIKECLRLSRGLPTVTHIRPQTESPVEINLKQGTILGLEHLWGLGHRKIGFIGFHSNCPDLDEEPRALGYREFWDGRDLPVPETLMCFEERGSKQPHEEFGMMCASLLFKRGATAIFCATDLIASGVLCWAHENDVSVPGPLSVLGFGNSALARLVYPALTSLHCSGKDVADITVDALLRMIEGKPPLPHQVLDMQLVPRASTAPVQRGKASPLRGRAK
jgi:LacI family transcriptional regulator